MKIQSESAYMDLAEVLVSAFLLQWFCFVYVLVYLLIFERNHQANPVSSPPHQFHWKGVLNPPHLHSQFMCHEV